MAARPASRLTLLALLLPPCLASVAAFTPTGRPTNQQEFVYLIIAKDIGAPELCAKIYPLAENGNGGDVRGYQVYYTRSLCYFDVAVKTADAKLCQEVRSLSTEYLDGSKYSKEECLKLLGHPEQLSNAGPRAPFFMAKPILTRMGYTQEMIPARLIRSNPDEAFMWREFYESIAKTPDFRARLGRLPDFSRTAEPVSTVTCEPHFIPTKSPWPPPEDVRCCPDFDGNGRCDDVETAANGLNMEDLAIEAVEGKPPRILCGDQPLRIEVRLRNTGRRTAHRGEGWVEIVNFNPLLFGSSKADLQIPIPEIPPGGAATVAFPPLKLVSTPTRKDSLNLDPRVLTARGESYANFIDLHIEAEAADSPRCAAERTLKDNPAGFGTPERRQSFASAVSVDVKFAREWPLVPIREGAPFEIKIEVGNRGTAPVAAGSGVVLLGGDDPGGFANGAADLIRPLPAMAPGATAMVSFAGVVYRQSASAPHGRYTQLTAVLCMREGCTRVAYLGKEVLKKGDVVAAVTPDAPREVRVGGLTYDYRALTLQHQNHSLMLLRGQTHVVYVYIRDATSPACRRQLQDLQQHLAEFRTLGAEVFIVSDDPLDSLKAIRSELGLELTVLLDTHHQFSYNFSRPESTSGAPPMALIVDRGGAVRLKKFASDGAARPSSAQLLAVLKGLPAR